MIFTTLLAAAAPALASGGNTGVSLMVHAEYLHVGPGEVVRNALVQVDEGQIVAVLPGRSAPDGALSVHSAHAGMIDASARTTQAPSAVEQSKEIITQLSVQDAIDPFDPAWAASRGPASPPP
jgi:hypothetical protein